MMFSVVFGLMSDLVSNASATDDSFLMIFAVILAANNSNKAGFG